MKKIIILFAVSICTLSVFAGEPVLPQDTIIKTIRTVIEKDSITGETITTTTTTTELKETAVSEKSKIEYDGSSYNFIFSWKKKKRLHPHWTGFGIGFLNYSDIPNGNIKMSKSLNFTINLFDFHKQISNSNWIFVSGIGSEWSNYHFDDNAALVKRDGITIFEPAPAGITYKTNKLTAHYVTIPLLLEYQVSSFHVSGGVVGFLKFYSRSHVKYYNAEGKKIKETMGRDLNIRPIDMKLRLQAGIGDISLYGYYSPFSMFDKNKGPDLKTYTIGLIIDL